MCISGMLGAGVCVQCCCGPVGTPVLPRRVQGLCHPLSEAGQQLSGCSEECRKRAEVRGGVL